MIETVLNGWLLNMRSSLWGQAAYSLFSAFFGTLLVVLFLSGLMPLAATVRYLPWIIVFTSAVAGYTLIDRTRDKLRYKKGAGAAIGLLVALLTCTTLNLMTWHQAGIGLIYWNDTLLMVVIGVVFGGLGAGLAKKYHRLMTNEGKKDF